MITNLWFLFSDISLDKSVVSFSPRIISHSSLLKNGALSFVFYSEAGLNINIILFLEAKNNSPMKPSGHE